MAIDKKSLQKLLNNPGMFNPADIEEEDIQDALAQKIQGGEEEPEMMGAEDMSDEDEAPEAAPQGAPAQPYTPSPEVMELMKKLKGPSPAEAEVQDEDISGDIGAPMELRKKAIERIKQKYLGQ
jgi:hypothetical protein